MAACSLEDPAFFDIKLRAPRDSNVTESGNATKIFDEYTCLWDMCKFEFSLYLEGAVAWSVSLKYLMACGSVLLWVNPRNDDFVSRGLLPYVHYVPVTASCKNISETVRALSSEQRHSLRVRLRAYAMAKLNMPALYDQMGSTLQKVIGRQQHSTTKSNMSATSTNPI